MYRRQNDKSTNGGKRGTVCGIPPSMLPRQLLQMVDAKKLLECLEEDYRVEHIVADKLESANRIEEAEMLKEATRHFNLREDYPILVDAYNKLISRTIKSIDDKKYYSWRSSYVFEKLLDDSNYKHELERCLEDKDSVISDRNLDYSKAYQFFPDVTKAKIDKLLNRLNNNWHYSSVANMISTAPEPLIPEIFDQVLKSKPKVKSNILSNSRTPNKYIPPALRAIAKKTYLPEVNVKITKEILEELPAIARLDVLESLVMAGGCKGLLDTIESADVLSNMLFSSTIRYPDRVSKVVKEFENRLRIKRQKTIMEKTNK